MTDIQDQRAVQDLAYLAGCAVREEIPDLNRISDFESVYALASRHMLGAVAAMALESAGMKDPQTLSLIAASVRKAVLFTQAFQQIKDRLEAAGIWYMPLKGAVLKDFYPRFGMREMADHDILIDAERAGDVKSIMKELGFREPKRNHPVHDQYFKAPVLNFEMHKKLFRPGLEGKIFDRFRDVKPMLISADGYEYRFSPEDFYLYITAHEYKHFSYAGIGLRSLLDIYVYLRKQDLDMAYIEAETEKTEITDFETANRSLAMHLFSGEGLTDADQKMLAYMLSSGAYGTIQNRVHNGVAKKGWWGYIRSRLTLPYEIMLAKYPILNRAPVLYPFCWIWRYIHAILFKRKEVAQYLKGLLETKKH